MAEMRDDDTPNRHRDDQPTTENIAPVSSRPAEVADPARMEALVSRDLVDEPLDPADLAAAEASSNPPSDETPEAAPAASAADPSHAAQQEHHAARIRARIDEIRDEMDRLHDEKLTLTRELAGLWSVI